MDNNTHNIANGHGLPNGVAPHLANGSPPLGAITSPLGHPASGDTGVISPLTNGDLPPINGKLSATDLVHKPVPPVSWRLRQMFLCDDVLFLPYSHGHMHSAYK